MTTKVEYPTKEQYDENVKRIHEEELHSELFKRTKEFISSLSKRKNIELEKKLFKIVGTYGLEDNLVNKSYNEKRIHKAKRYDKLKQFMNSLTPEQILSDIYLTSVSKFIETSLIDCSMIIENLRKKVKNLDISDKNRRFEIYMDIPKERVVIFPITICETISIPYYRPQDYKRSYVDLLDENNKHIYKKYNEYVRVTNKLVEDIYQLQMWNLLSCYPEQIANYSFIIDNEYKHEFRTTFLVKKCRESNIENKSKLEPTKMDDIPVNEDEQLSLDDGPKLILKMNNSNKKRLE